MTPYIADIKKLLDEGYLVEGIHYGTHGGRRVLYKSGSELLLAHFQINVLPQVSETHDEDGHLVYRVECHGQSRHDGVLLGIGIGQCSTGEGNWGWREALCREEFDATREDRRRQYFWREAPNGVSQSRLEIRTNPADRANMALKMAKKRAQVDLALTALACSELFTQDLEETIPAASSTPSFTVADTNQPVPDAGKTISKAKLDLLRSHLALHAKSEAKLCERLGIKRLESLRANRMNAAMEWIRE